MIPIHRKWHAKKFLIQKKILITISFPRFFPWVVRGGGGSLAQPTYLHSTSKTRVLLGGMLGGAPSEP